jgi:hypothetical protein
VTGRTPPAQRAASHGSTRSPFGSHRAALAVGIAAALLASPAALDAQAPEVRWPEPTRESRPWTRWWWMGSAVDTANLSRELRALRDAGFGGVEVTSIYGARGLEAAYVPYLSDRWVELLLHTATEAGRLGLGVDMPPGSGWRTGGPDVPLERSSSRLRIRVDTVAGGSVWTTDPAGRRIEAVTAVSSAGRTVDLGARLRGVRVPRWRAPRGEWRVYTAETRFGADSVKRPAPGGAGYAIDVFSRDAVEHFLDGYGERLRLLPHGTLRALFHDSFEYTGDGSLALFDTFRARHGYGLESRLAALAGDGDPDIVARVKSDYRETLDELLLSAFLQPLTAWSRAHGSVSRNQAHGSPGNLLDLYAASDIPETEIFGPLGGPDADPLVSKFASSAAHLAGKPLTSAEAMTWLGEHFTVSLDAVKRAADQLFLSGVNHLIYHGTAYSPREVEWPGWLFYASTQFNPRNTLWRDLPALNAYVTRVQGVLQQGRPDADVLLYWPIHDDWHDPSGMRIDFRVHSPRWLHDRPVGAAARALWSRGYAFDYLSDRLLRDRVSVAGGRLHAGDAEYRAIVVPAARYMPHETLARLAALAAEGATVLFVGDLPEDVPGLGRLAERRARFRAARSTMALGPPDAAGVRTSGIGRGRILLADRLEDLLAAADLPREELATLGVGAIRRRMDDGRYVFLSHRGTGAVDGWVRLAHPAAAVALMHPLSGRTGFARTRAAADGGTDVFLQLDPGESLVLRTFDASASGQPWRYLHPSGDPVELAGTWEVEFVEGGPSFPPPYATRAPGSWTERGGEAERFAGAARYGIRFDAPADAPDFLLDLGRVAESARVRLNGRELGTLFAAPFRIVTGPLAPRGNVLEVEVTNLAANRIRDLDRRGVQWKTFHDINFVGIDYRPFDASGWPVRESGLLGPVMLTPLHDDAVRQAAVAR